MNKMFEFFSHFTEKMHHPKCESTDKGLKLHRCPICHEIHY